MGEWLAEACPQPLGIGVQGLTDPRAIGAAELFEMYDTDRSSKTQLHSMIQLIEEKRGALLQQLEDIQMVMTELEAAEQRCVNSLNSLKSGAD